ncbi:lysosomal Pro-X carboxypeptidase-like isoform X2 [Brevipalpus obovatus]|uniref:lysosomal Pro-X carboxypeptidase-like isoform X2 n=1 Tax=Brevipalpus obovatus TaxID=246614 RepID=UPI003D9F415E
MIFLNWILGLVITITCLPSSYADPIPANFTVTYYEQKVDHFNYINNATFPQRMIVSTDHWCNQCPIFFYAGNEGDIFSFANNTGFMWENAQKFGAMVMFVEHRYYGVSLPFGNSSYANLSTLGYLTVEQAMADYADILFNFRSTKGTDKSPVIMFGGSYGGMIAAWFRMKYPHLVVGSLASSAPIEQFQGLYDCRGYNDRASKSFRDYSENCFQSIKKCWNAFNRVGSTDEGLQWLHDTFHLCQDLKASDLSTFVGWISDSFGTLAMIDYPNPADFLAPLPAFPINYTCQQLQHPEHDDKALLVDIYNAISVFYNFTGQTTCNDYKDSSDSGRLGGDGWNFQACTEMVLPICSIGNDTMFPEQQWDVDAYKKQCFQTYGIMSDIYKAEQLFGGQNISTATNIIFSNGERDPWAPGGFYRQISPSLVNILIPHACHHEDLRPTGPNDPPSLLAIRRKEVEIITQWIKDYYHSIQYWPREIWSQNRGSL